MLNIHPQIAVATVTHFIPLANEEIFPSGMVATSKDGISKKSCKICATKSRFSNNKNPS